MLTDLVTTNRLIPGVAIHVEMPPIGVSWSGAAGLSDVARRTPLKAANPVRIASNTKTFVAVAILRLWEQGRLDLDAPIAEYLSAEYLAVLSRGGYTPETMSPRHLLTHTSGLYDYSDSEEFYKACAANPKRRWTRLEQVQGAMDWGRPYGAPGAVYSYSDTGYLLLGEILERRTGLSMGMALRDLVGYQDHRLTATWLETLEPEPPGILDRAHQYEGNRDTYDDDPSSDLYGGGGLASTVTDLALFMRSVFMNEVFAQPATLDTMLSTIPGTIAGPPSYGQTQMPGEYRMGVFVRELEGVTVHLHTGYWGTLAAYVPSLDLAIGISVTQQQTREAREIILQRILELMKSER
ncbi:MAG: beta-lactamase family protein [Verrucomicrobiae bacterium]|nr:beta-lactamase family protein [Verrucomicrobiae bacterium]